MVTLTLDISGPPKRQIIELAFGDIGSAGYEFGRTPEEVNDALLRLNALMREYPFSALTYNQPTYGVGLADELSGIPDQFLSVVAAKLAQRICATMGATLSPEAKANLAYGMVQLHTAAASIPTMPYARGTPVGAGTESAFTGPFVTPDSDDTGDLAAIIDGS